MAYHLLESYCGGDHTKQILNHGYLAVDFFFVLSGFVIGYAYDDRWAKGLTTGAFFRRRLIRLHPRGVFGTLLGAALFYFGACEEWKPIAETSFGRLALVTLICCTILPLGKSLDIRGWVETNPLNGPVWSLQWEYLANILYAVVIRRFKTWMLALSVGAAAFLTLNLALNWDVFHVFAARDYAAYTVIGGWSLTADQLVIGLSRLLYPFFAGVLLARLGLLIPVRRFGFALTTGLVFVFLAMPYFAPGASPCVNGLYEAAVILIAFPLIVSLGAGAALPSGRGAGFCTFLGEISYPLYLTHFPFVYMQKAWVMNHPAAASGQHLGVSLGVFALALFLSFAVFKLYDLPVRTWLSRRRGRRTLIQYSKSPKRVRGDGENVENRTGTEDRSIRYHIRIGDWPFPLDSFRPGENRSAVP